MKIHIDGVNFVSGNRTGPGTFANRLARRLIESGNEISLSGEKADISLVFIEPSGAKLAKKVVQRLDGIWSKPNEFVSRNRLIKSMYERCDAVVHQSNFDRKFIEKHWGIKSTFSVIHNGVLVKPITSFKSATLNSLRSQYELVFSCSANWHKQKRLKSNIDAFMHFRSTLNKKCCLIVMGSNPDHVIADKDIFYTGSVPEDVYMEVYSMSDWMLHLAWRDHCPNTCVESLSQGTPIFCTEDSGTVEIMRGYGISIKEKFQNDFQPFDYDNPPEIDVTEITELPKLERSLIPDVSIETCTNSYISLFKQVLCQ